MSTAETKSPATREDLLRFVVRAVIDSADRKRAEWNVRSLAEEAGVEDHHVEEAIRELASRKWISMHLGGSFSFGAPQRSKMLAFLQPLPNRERSAAEVASAIAAALLDVIRSGSNATISGIAAAAHVLPGNVRRVLAHWDDAPGGSGLFVSGDGSIDWNSDTVEFLEAEVHEPLVWPETPTAAAVHLHQGDLVSGAKVVTTIEGSTVGAVAIGEGATATGNTGELTQVAHREAIKRAQKALVDDQDELESVVYETMEQFLRIARETQIEMERMSSAQKRMRELLEEVWAKNVAEQLRPIRLPEGLATMKELLSNPLMVEAVKFLLGSGGG